MEIVTWPFRRFISYVCGKLLAGYLASDLDFQKLGYHDGALSVRDIVLNPAKINESLKDIPYKVLNANIQSLKVAVPRHFLTESIKVTLSDIDVLIMPICNDKKKGPNNLAGAQCLIPKPEAKPVLEMKAEQSPPAKAEAESPPPEEPPEASTAQIPKDEDGLTRAINRVLQNLECEIHNLTIRVLTCEFHQDDLTKGVDIPTVLLRFTRIEYRNSVAPAKAEDNASSNLKSEVPPPAPALEEKRLAKTVLIGQYALFLMDRPILSRDEFGRDSNIAKLSFPFSYPPICHPSTLLVSETNGAMAARIQLELDFEKKQHKVTCSFNNIDILVTPLQIYTLAKMADYAAYLFATVSPPAQSSPCESVAAVHISAPALAKPASEPKKVAPSPPPPAPQDRVEVNLEIFRISARVLFEDPKDFKRYYHPYKSEELCVEGQIQTITWKIPYNFFEFLLVNTQCQAKLDSQIALSGQMKYISITSNVLQNFALKRTGQVLDDSVSTIYASAHRAFAVQSEAPNFLAEDSVINPNRFHFCLQRIIEVKSSKAVPMTASNMITDECEATIEGHLPPVRGMDESHDAVQFAFKLEKKQGKITGDQCINLFDRGARIGDDANSVITLISVSVATAGIALELSPEVPLYLDHVLNPTGGILFQQPAQYARIAELYNTESLSPELSEMASVLEEFTGALKMPAIPPPSSPSCESKDWILQKLELKVPFIRAKCWILDPKRNQLFDFYRDRNVDSCKQFLDKMRSPAPAGKAQQQTLLRDNPYAMVQICRCMDICRVSDMLSGKYNREAASLATYQYMYYKDELLVLDVLGLSLSAREIYESSAMNGRIVIQALLADAKLEGINLYGHIEGRMRWLGRTQFATAPYSVRFVSRDRITHSNKLLADAEIVGDAVRVEYKAEENAVASSEPEPGARESEIGVIEPCSVKANNKEVVQVDFQQEGESEKFNPFVREASEFLDRELQLKQSAKTYINTNVKQVAVCLNIEFIAVLSAYLEACEENVSKLQYILDNKVTLMRDIESYRKEETRKRRRKEKPQQEEAKAPPATRPETKKAEDTLDSALDLPLIREESKISVAAKSDSSSESSEEVEEEKKSTSEQEKAGGKEPAIVGFVLEIAVSDISAYLAESKPAAELIEEPDMKESPATVLDDDKDNPTKHQPPMMAANTMQPLLALKLQGFQGLMYKFADRDTQLKLQIGTAVLLDNSLCSVPRYSPYVDTVDFSGMKRPSPPYVSDNLIRAQEDVDYFLASHPDKVLLYKEDAMKGAPMLTLTLRLTDRTGANLSESDFESECVMDLGFNGIVLRPELHTRALARIIRAFQPTPQVAPSPVIRKRDSEMSYERLMSMTRKSPIQAPAPPPCPKQLIKLNLSVRNLTLDLWPVVPVSVLMEIDPPKHAPSNPLGKDARCRSRQRTLLLLDRLNMKYVSAQFVGQEKCEAHMEDTRLVCLDTDLSSPTLLRDGESLLNSTLSKVHRLGFSDIATLERLELRFSSQNERVGEENLPAQRVEVCVTTLVSTTCYDSLVTAIRASNGVMAEIGDFQLGIEAATKPPAPISVQPAGGIKERVEPNVEEEKKRSYEVVRQARQEELRLSKDIGAGKEDVDKMFEIVSQEYKREGKITMRANEKIDSEAMKEAIAAMDANPDYISQPSVVLTESKPDEKIEGEVIMRSGEEGNGKIAKGVEILNDHVSQPKQVLNQYEIEFHALPAGYDRPRLTFCVSVNKVAFILFDGSDFDVPAAPDELPGPGSFVMVDNPVDKEPHKHRKADSFVEVSLLNVGLVFYQFPGKKLHVFRTTLSIEDIGCSESLSQSLATSMLGMIHHERAEHVVKVAVEMLNSAFGPNMVDELPELILKVKVEPLQFLLHQKVLEFLREYAGRCQKELLDRRGEKPEAPDAVPKRPEEEHKSPKPAPAQRDLFVQKATISQFYVKFDYRSYKLTMSNLYKKEMLELLNIADIRDLVITFKKFEGRGFNTVEELVKAISQHYTNDIVNNQLLTCVTAVSPIRSITNIVGGFVDIFRLPMQSYRKRRRLWAGLTEGLGSFASKVAIETKLIGQTVSCA